MSSANEGAAFAPGSVVSVTLLNRIARERIETALPLLWVSGEVSNLTVAGSGHAYFTLKDHQAQVRCVMFRARAQLLPFRLANGHQIEVRALPTLYEARGDFQLNVEAVRRAGVGALWEAFGRLKEDLERRGLLAPERKRPLPMLPRCVAVITSLQAAALQDILVAFSRRAPGVEVVILPAPVQGEAAPGAIAARIAEAAKIPGAELAILARGGGSIEDLWAFNDPVLAEAIVQSRIPVLTGIGHESDTTIADLVADCRAATPTAAAELASEGWLKSRVRVERAASLMDAAITRRLADLGQRIDRASRALRPPSARMAEHLRACRRALQTLGALLARRIAVEHTRLQSMSASLSNRQPELPRYANALITLERRLGNAVQLRLHQSRHRVELADAGLSALAPNAVLARGYAIVRNATGAIVSRHSDLVPGDAIAIEFSTGIAHAHVEDSS